MHPPRGFADEDIVSSKFDSASVRVCLISSPKAPPEIERMIVLPAVIIRSASDARSCVESRWCVRDDKGVAYGDEGVLSFEGREEEKQKG